MWHKPPLAVIVCYRAFILIKMEKFFYQNYTVVFTPDYIMSDFIKENELDKAEIVQMFQEDKVKGYYDSEELYYQYQIIFKCPLS